MPGACTIEMVQQLEAAGPFGAGAPAPRFALPNCKIAFAKRAGENHLRLTLADDTGGRIDAIAFNAFDGPLGPALSEHRGARFHIAGRLEIDDWGVEIIFQHEVMIIQHLTQFGGKALAVK